MSRDKCQQGPRHSDVRRRPAYRYAFSALTAVPGGVECRSKWREVVRSGELSHATSGLAASARDIPRDRGARHVFTGEYRHSVDDKGRLAVPARFRAQLEGGAVVCKWLDNCLAILTRNGWEELADKTATLPLTNPGSRAFQRHIFGGAAEVELDRQGRVVLPSYLREYAALEGDVVIVGARDHAEIWAPARWDDVRRSLEDPETLAAHLDGLGI
jgi:MraZ protein